MLAVIVILLACGPLVIAATAMGIMGSITGMEWGALRMGLTFVTLQVLAAGAVSTLYRWCFVRPPVRGAGLAAAMLVSILLVSHPSLLELLAAMFSAEGSGPSGASLFSVLVIEGLTVLGIACVVCMVIVLMLELPVRWVEGDWAVVSDGTFRAVRIVGLVVLMLVCSALIRDEAGRRILQLLQRALV